MQYSPQHMCYMASSAKNIIAERLATSTRRITLSVDSPFNLLRATIIDCNNVLRHSSDTMTFRQSGLLKSRRVALFNVEVTYDSIIKTALSKCSLLYH